MTICRADATIRALLLAVPLMVLGSIFAALTAEAVTPQHLQRIEALQRRADVLAFGNIGSGNYYLAKARTWLDFALSEYYVADSSGVASAAIEEAEALLVALEQERPDISMNTTLRLPGGKPARPGLADTIDALKGHAHFSCGQRHVAEAEVYLVWTAHEEDEYGWSHAEPYALAAESRIRRARGAIDDCAAIAAAMPDSPPPPERTTLSGDTMFAFGKASLNPSAPGRLDKLLDGIRNWTKLEFVELVGHTDHLSRDGRQEHNLLLSRQRAESIKQYLISRGIPAEKVHATGAGSTRPLVKCPSRQSWAWRVACLEPNRRVEIILHGIK